MKKITLSIFVPCFNEENNINNTLNNIKKGVRNINYEILVADDASTDKSIDLIEKFKIENSKVDIKIFKNKKNKGVGFNFYETAHNAEGKYYMMINGDAVDPPSEINKLVSNIGKSDMILSYLIDKRGLFRKTLSRIFVLLINLITLNNIKYYNGPNIYLLENVKLYSGGTSGFSYQAELITEQIRQKKTYIEIEIDPYPETSETSQSLSLHSVTSVMVSIVSIFFKQIIYVVKKILKIKKN